MAVKPIERKSPEGTVFMTDGTDSIQSLVGGTVQRDAGKSSCVSKNREEETSIDPYWERLCPCGSRKKDPIPVRYAGYDTVLGGWGENHPSDGHDYVRG